MKDFIQITTEQAFDILPQVTSIYEKVDIKKFAKDYFMKNKSKKKNAMAEIDADVTQKLAGVEIFVYIGKQLPKVKTEAFEIVSILEGKSVEDVAKQPLVKTMRTLKAVFSDPELNDFFKQAME